MYSDTWAATDGLGRAVTMGKPGDGLRRDRTVGMFYFLANHVPGAPVYDITKILTENPLNPHYGPFGSAHWWGEPWFGYYQSDDRAVIRKHMQMLADAGVDVIIFDNTNGPTYPDVYIPLCEVVEEMRAQGNPTPQIAFFTGHGAWSTLYRDFYARNLYPDLWFRWKGKPLMMAHLEKGDQLPPEVTSYFNVRESWAWTPSEWFGDGHDKGPWLDNVPQNFGWHEDPKTPEEVSVCVGQHATSSIGRSSLGQKEPEVDALRVTPYTPVGRCFAQQFELAIQIDPEFIFVTGWNEWTATRFQMDHAGIMAGRPEPKGGTFFVDEYNAEFSRDIEPSNGIISDNYYYQLVDFVRRYKGARPAPVASRKQINLSAGFGQWASVLPEFQDDVGDPVHRNAPGWADLHYVNDSGRNDIVAAKVAYDDRNVYFYVRTAAPLTAPSGDRWMLLLIKTGPAALIGGPGHNYVVDRERHGARCTVESASGGSISESAEFRTRGNELMIAVPRKLLGGSRSIDFKWADNVEPFGNMRGWTTDGDVAPNDRFFYRADLGN
jgi:hypothetical protein